MTERSVTHATFVVERSYPASPERVFAAFATLEAKSRWFGAPADTLAEDPMFDFRVGGRERFVAKQPGKAAAHEVCLRAASGRVQQVAPEPRLRR